MTTGKTLEPYQSLFEKGQVQGDSIRFMIPLTDGTWRPITWTEYLNFIEQATGYLYQEGVKSNVKVSIFANTRVEWAYCGLAIQFCRGVFVPVYHSNTPEQVKYIVNHSDSEFLFAELERLSTVLSIINDIPLVKKIIVMDLKDEDSLLAEVDRFNQLHNQRLKPNEIKKRIISIDQAFQIGADFRSARGFQLDALAHAMQPDDVSAILYTSGTTGVPKGVMLTNYNLTQNTADWLAVLGGLMPETKVDLLWLPTSHIFGWGELGLGNLLNFTTYFTTPYEALKVMPQVKPTVFFSVPAYWESLYIQSVSASTDKNAQIEKLRQLTGGRLKFCLSGGAGLKREAKTFFYEAGLLIIEGYGLTECSPTLTMNRGDDFDFDTVGKAFPSVQLKIASDGELLAKGPNVFQGYYKNPEATQETFDSEGWFKTGDLVELTNKGFYKIRGRKKDIIVTSGGKNIAPLSIEAIFINNPYIEHIVLYGNERKYLTALVTLREQTASAYAKNLNIPFDSFSELIERKEIIQLVHDQIEQANLRLASFETVKRFFIYDGHLTVEDDFLTPSLKLKRKNVHERFKERFEALYELKRD